MFGVTILGNNSALPAYNRHPTSQVVTLNDMLFLLDCGEGTQMQMNRFKIRKSRIQHIFISHLHGDHYFGLAPLLTTYSLNDRRTPLHLYAPPDLEMIIKLQVMASDSELPFPFYFHPLEKEGVLIDEPQYSIRCFKVVHRIETWGFVFQEKRKPRKINGEKIKQYSIIPTTFYEQLQWGEDFVLEDNSIVKNAEVTVANTPPKSYVYCADTSYSPGITKHFENATMLYHESTYLKDQEERAASRNHSTAQQAALIARAAGVQKLLIGHFSSQYENDKLFLFEDEASEVFPHVQLALEGATYEI
ncbi:MAG: ribonuclease Z [Bacteroidota bacterium]|nr:ribonuclease Z [Bacteroidota bacterium]